MTMTDPISDMLSRIRNASTAMHDEVSIPSSKIKESIAKILVEEEYMDSIETVHNGTHSDIKIRQIGRAHV